MITFACDHCGQLLFFDNLVCERCGRDLGLDPRVWDLRPVRDGDRRCANHAHGCGWLAVDDGETYCRSCRLTRTRPPLDDPDTVTAWVRAEAAKRRLVFQAERLGLDLSGLCFDLLSSREQPVTTGHADGVVTLDLAEADDVVRTRMRAQLDEPYRTLLGHFRHEFGHYVWARYVDRDDRVQAFRDAFGDERADYAAALQAHYGSPRRTDWTDRYVSHYAAAHPWEDFAETVAHYLHITDVLETAAAVGIAVDGPHPVLTVDGATPEPSAAAIQDVVDRWLPLTYALNEVTRSMGADDLYPFVLAPAVIGKLGWVHRLVQDVARDR